VAAQSTLWQPASHYSMRVGKTVKTSVVELHGDLSDVRKLHWATARLYRGGSRSWLLLGEDLPLSIGVEGGDPSTTTKAVADRDATL
jgi:hypothetical protein